MKLQYLQAQNGEERIYLDIQGSVHAYLRPREAGLPNWEVEIFDLDPNPKKVRELYRDIYNFVSEEFGTTNMDEFRLIEWQHLASRAQILEETQPPFSAQSHEASIHGFMEQCRKVPKKWANARMNVEREKLEKSY